MAEERHKIELLNGSNYQSWKHDMKFVLMEKGLWGFIDGTEIAPPAEEEGENDQTNDQKLASQKTKAIYKAKSEKAYSTIALAVEKSIKIHVTTTTNPKDAWEILKKQFSFVSVTQIVRITRKFYAASMQENGDLQEHLTVMSTLAQQLRELDEEVSPQKFATAVLGSLPSSYDIFITSLNARDKDNFDWDSIKGALLEEDMKRKDKIQQATSRGGEDALFTSRNSDGGGRGRNDYRGDNYYRGGSQQRRGEDAMFTNRNTGGGGGRNDYRGGQQRNDFDNRNNRNNHNFNNHNRNNRGGNNNNRNQINCYRCGEEGHVARHCNNTARWNNQNSQGREQVNVAEFQTDGGVHHDIALCTTNLSANNVNEGAENSDWFIDSAASKHMTFHKDIMHDYENYETPHPVSLGDDSTILAEGKGKVSLPLYNQNEGSCSLFFHCLFFSAFN